MRRMTAQEAKIGVEFTPRVLISLFRGTMPMDDILALQAASVSCRLLKSYGVSSVNIRVAGITPMQLKELGCQSAFELRELGFDALDLNNHTFCASAISAFGADELKKAFLMSAGDAVCLAGSTAQFQLDIASNAMIAATAGCPAHAMAVLQQLHPKGASLFGCEARMLLDSGLRAKQLSKLGYHTESLREQVAATEEDLTKMGF